MLWVSFSALKFLIQWQEEHLTTKNLQQRFFSQEMEETTTGIRLTQVHLQIGHWNGDGGCWFVICRCVGIDGPTAASGATCRVVWCLLVYGRCVDEWRAASTPCSTRIHACQTSPWRCWICSTGEHTTFLRLGHPTLSVKSHFQLFVCRWPRQSVRLVRYGFQDNHMNGLNNFDREHLLVATDDLFRFCGSKIKVSAGCRCQIVKSCEHQISWTTEQSRWNLQGITISPY